VHKFACESIFEIKVAGRFTSDLVRAAVKVRPHVAVKMFLPQLCQTIINRASSSKWMENRWEIFLSEK